MGYANPMVFIPILIGLLGVASYYLWQKMPRGKAKSGTQVEEKKPERLIPVHILDWGEKRDYNSSILESTAIAIKEEHGILGIPLNEDGKGIIVLNKLKNKMWPIRLPLAMSNAATELHYDVEQPEWPLMVDEILKEDDKPFIEKYGMVLWWMAVMGFLAFLWANA